MLVDLTVSRLSADWEMKHGEGDYWWLSILRAFVGTGKGDGSAAGEPRVDPQNVRWM